MIAAIVIWVIAWISRNRASVSFHGDWVLLVKARMQRIVKEVAKRDVRIRESLKVRLVLTWIKLFLMGCFRLAFEWWGVWNFEQSFWTAKPRRMSRKMRSMAEKKVR